MKTEGERRRKNEARGREGERMKQEGERRRKNEARGREKEEE